MTKKNTQSGVGENSLESPGCTTKLIIPKGTPFPLVHLFMAQPYPKSFASGKVVRIAKTEVLWRRDARLNLGADLPPEKSRKVDLPTCLLF